jgi:hypothetical protein
VINVNPAGGSSPAGPTYVIGDGGIDYLEFPGWLAALLFAIFPCEMAHPSPSGLTPATIGLLPVVRLRPPRHPRPLPRMRGSADGRKMTEYQNRPLPKNHKSNFRILWAPLIRAGRKSAAIQPTHSPKVSWTLMDLM